MVYLYLASCLHLQDPKENIETLDAFPKLRIEKTLRHRSLQKRLQSLGANILLSKILEKHGYSMDDIVYGKNGKPEIEGIYINISHSEDMVICAISDMGNVGCDIEKIRNAPMKVADRYFDETECMYLYNLEKERQEEAFFRIWTLKESYMKMTGEGLKLGLHKLRISLDDKVELYREGVLCKCYLKEYMIPGYRIAICTEDKDITNTIEYVQID